MTDDEKVNVKVKRNKVIWLSILLQPTNASNHPRPSNIIEHENLTFSCLFDDEIDGYKGFSHNRI